MSFPSAPLAFACLASAFLAGCPGGTSYPSGTSVKHGVSASGAGAGGSTSTTGSGSSGASGGTTTSGSSGSSQCPQLVLDHPLVDCSPGQVEVVGLLYDFDTESALGSEPGIQIGDLNTQTMGTYTTCGIFYYCLAPGGTVSPDISIPGYLDTLLPPITTGDGGSYYYAAPGIFVVNDQLASAEFTQIPLMPPFDVSQGTVLTSVSDDMFPACNVDAGNEQGWQFELQDSNGLVLDAGGLAYFSSNTPDPTATATDHEGVALFYNLPAALSSVTFVGTNPGAEDAGFDCPYNGLQRFGISATIPVRPNKITFVPFAIP